MNLDEIIQLAKNNQGEKALNSLKVFVEENSSDTKAIFMLASWAFQNMDWDDSELYMVKLLALEPQNIKYLNNIVGMHMQMSNYKKAIEYQLKIVEIAPDNLEWTFYLGMLYHQIFDFDNALKLFKEVHVKDPKNLQVLGVIADMTHGFGDFDQAKLYYRQILKEDPLSDAAVNGIVKSTKYKESSEEIFNYSKLFFNTPGTKEEAKAQVHLSLAKMFDDCKLYDKAWENYCKGNEIMSNLYPFNVNSLGQQVEEIKKIFNTSFFEGTSLGSHNECSPVFIVGMPRSGTTLLEQVLEHSGNFCAGGESIALNKAISKEFYKIKYPVEISKAENGIYDKLADDYLNFFKNCHVDGDKTPLDKLPGNFLHLGLIKKIFPKVKIINLTRNREDCAFSIFFQMFANHMSFTTNLKNINLFYDVYLDTMKHWNTLFPENILNINYEDLVTDFEANTQKIYKFLDVDWNESVNNFVNSKNSVQTPSSWQVRQGINTKSIGRSSNYHKFIK